MSALIDVTVTQVRALTPVVREFTLRAPSGDLPGYSAGSHVVVHMPGDASEGGRGFRNAYSLLSDPADRSAYRIAVRLQASSRGGSRYMHARVAVGSRLQVSPPANLFAPDSRARHHLLIAGGIGITPFMAYVAELGARGGCFELHYAFHSGRSDAYVTQLAAELGSRLHGYDAAVGQRLDVDAVLAAQPIGTHVYVCGPQTLLEGVRQSAARLGWPASRVHWEAFAAAAPGEPFVVELARDGRRLAVGAEQSLLEALESAGVAVPNLCRGGVCGQCVTAYRAAAVEHRDSYLSDAERATHLMPCVSRGCAGTRLLLDL
ncbi:MAG: PDR/VanB family oxidoreductase [Rhodocyclaceae bacterium]